MTRDNKQKGLAFFCCCRCHSGELEDRVADTFTSAGPSRSGDNQHKRLNRADRVTLVPLLPLTRPLAQFSHHSICSHDLYLLLVDGSLVTPPLALEGFGSSIKKEDQGELTRRKGGKWSFMNIYCHSRAMTNHNKGLKDN